MESETGNSPRSETHGHRQQATFDAAQRQPNDRARVGWKPGIGTVVAQLSVPNKTALRKCFHEAYLRRADLDERRGQDSPKWTSFSYQRTAGQLHLSA